LFLSRLFPDTQQNGFVRDSLQETPEVFAQLQKFMSTGRANSTYVRYRFTFDSVDVQFDARVDWVAESAGTGASGPSHGGVLVPHFQSEVPQTLKGKSKAGSDLKQAIQLTDPMITDGINSVGDDQAQFWRNLGRIVLDRYNSSRAGTGDRLFPDTGVAHWVKPKAPTSSPEYISWDEARKDWNRRWEEAKLTLTVTVLQK
jgi:hypothetical protein